MMPELLPSQALAVDRIYERLFNRGASAADTTPAASPAEPGDTWEPSSQRPALPTVTYSLRGNT